MAVVDQDGVPAVEDRPVKAVDLERLELDRVAVEVEILGVVGVAQEVGRAVAQGEGVVAVDVEIRADDENQAEDSTRSVRIGSTWRSSPFCFLIIYNREEGEPDDGIL
jgi:hypothetical protein